MPAIRAIVRYTSNSFNRSALPLFMLGIFTDDHDAALALNHLAFFTYGLDRRFYFHLGSLPVPGGICASFSRFRAQRRRLPLSFGTAPDKAPFYLDLQVILPLVRS